MSSFETVSQTRQELDKTKTDLEQARVELEAQEKSHRQMTETSQARYDEKLAQTKADLEQQFNGKMVINYS